MRITFDPRAADELAYQIEYLIDRHAVAAAIRLEARCNAFLEQFLATHPRSGKYIAEAKIWETWIPGTRLIIWYRFRHNELQVLRIWHAAQRRTPEK
jgi:plasmid stabilization system protein ParE